MGQCSTTVALPLISACGVECAVLPSAILSNHTGGFRHWSFADLTDNLAQVEAEWVSQDIRFDAFYTGYVCEAHIDPILSIAASCAAPGALRFVDPAMADAGVLYCGFGADFPAKMARLVAGADYVLPNLTEAALLVGEDPARYVGATPATRPEIEALIAKVHALGARTVVLTGVSFDPELLGCAVSDGIVPPMYSFEKRNPRSTAVFSESWPNKTSRKESSQ